MLQMLAWTKLFDFCQVDQAEDDEIREEEEDTSRLLMTPDGEIIRLRPELARPIDPEDLDPTTELHLVHTEPPIKVAPDFLTELEMQHLLELVSNRWMPSHVKDRRLGPDVLKGQPSQQRSSWSGVIQHGETPMIQELEKRLSGLAGMDVSHLEKLSLVRYMPGQQYLPHHDGRCRPVTVFCYLNELPDDAEGETYFPKLNIKFVPRKGSAVVWNNSIPSEDGSPNVEDTRTLHAGLPPKAGVKYGLNCFFNEKVQRGPCAEVEQTPAPIRAIPVPAGILTPVQPVNQPKRPNKTQMITMAPVPMQSPIRKAQAPVADIRMSPTSNQRVTPTPQTLPVLLPHTSIQQRGSHAKDMPKGKALPALTAMQPASAMPPVGVTP
mmetsp:Transcript_119192/g.216711  ORF Transcript_119192/g.216711 Transcript_119192/m.216711 type:complete len:380 (-) Transcript_119192:60-1199(-)